MPISEVYNMDCLEYMKTLPDKYFDLCIADPPFGINIHKSGRLKKYNKEWVDNEIPTKEVFDEMFRVSKDIIIWGGNYFLDYLGSTKCFLIYDKKQPQEVSFASCEFAWTSFDKVAKTFYYSPMQMKDRIHSCQKPIALYAWILDNYANGGGVKSLTHSWVAEVQELRLMPRDLISMPVNWIKNITIYKKRDFKSIDNN